MTKPNLFVVGNPKCGTTALYKFLEQHPDIFYPKAKEPSYFSKDLINEINEFYKKHERKGKLNTFNYPDKESYLNLFKNVKEKIAVDSSTHYLYSKVAAKEIKKFNPDAKIIILLREPTDFLNSLYNNEFGQIEDAPNLKAALAREEDRKKGIYTSGVFPPVSLLFYSERIKYYDQVKRYLDEFPRKNVMIIIYENFKKDNLGTCKKIFKWLGVDDSFVPRFSQEYVSTNVRFKWLKTKLHLIVVSPFFRKIKSNLPWLWKPLEKTYQKIFYSHQKLDKMDPILKKNLKKKFKPEVEKINKIVNEDLVKLWSYDD